MPTWSEVRAGTRPPDAAEGESGEWQHGWQFWSSSVTDACFRKLTLLSGRSASSRAHLRSYSGRNAGVALAHCPTAPEFTILPHLFRTLLLERLHLPLQIMEVKRRATPIERMTARVFREAGACVRQNAFLRDMNVDVPAQDSRQIEVLAQGLPCHGGMQLAVDITLRSAVSCTEEAHRHAADCDGAVLWQARQDKEATHPELASSGRCKLVVLAIETGGRWSEEAAQILQMLAHSSTRRTSIHAVLCGAHVGKTMDANVGHRVRCLLRLFPGGASAKHFLVPH